MMHAAPCRMPSTQQNSVIVTENQSIKWLLANATLLEVSTVLLHPFISIQFYLF